MLCQVLPSALSVPETVLAPGAAGTVTLVTLPWVAVTVIPAEGLTARLPLAGVIFSSEAISAACADADADADAETWAGVRGAALLHPAASSPMAAAAMPT